ncbi:unnamed protein product [Brassica oleracea]
MSRVVLAQIIIWSIRLRGSEQIPSQERADSNKKKAYMGFTRSRYLFLLEIPSHLLQIHRRHSVQKRRARTLTAQKVPT